MKGDFLICNIHEHAMVVWKDKDDNCPLCKAKRNIKIQSEMIDELTKKTPEQSEQVKNLKEYTTNLNKVKWKITELKNELHRIQLDLDS